MRRLLFLCLATAGGLCAADAWDKVKELKSGAEVRIFKKGSAQPVTARFDELREESILVVVKNEQVAISKADIDRLDARPEKGSRIKTESKTTTDLPDARPAPMGTRPATGNTSYSSGVSLGSKPDFETVYRRGRPEPPKADQK